MSEHQAVTRCKGVSTVSDRHSVTIRCSEEPWYFASFEGPSVVWSNRDGAAVFLDATAAMPVMRKIVAVYREVLSICTEKAPSFRPCGCCELPDWCETKHKCHRIERGLGNVATNEGAV